MIIKQNTRINQLYLRQISPDQYYINQLIEEIKVPMGCTPNFERLSKPSLQNHKPRSTIQIQFIAEKDDEQTLAASSNAKQGNKNVSEETDQVEQKEQSNEKIKQRQQKIRYLQGSKNFMEISIEASNYVNHALVTLSKNPLLYDQSYPKLIGLNKKALYQKQNRYSYLTKKQQKMELQIKKEKEKVLEQCKSHYFGKRISQHKPQKKIKMGNKENRMFPSLFYTLNKDSHNEKTETLDKILACSQKILEA